MMNVSPKKRLRTEAQLARKRLSDKVNHKAKRDRTKSQMDKLEVEMVQLRQRVKDISEQLQVLHADVLRSQNPYTPPTVKTQQQPLPLALTSLSPNAHPVHVRPAPFVPSNASEPREGGAAGGAGMDYNVGYQPALSFPHTSPSPTTTATTTVNTAPSFSPSTPRQIPSPPPSAVFGSPAPNVNGIKNIQDVLAEEQNRVLVDCRCGVEHKHPSECLEYSTFLILLRTHEHLSRSIYNTPLYLPRNPSILGLFRHTSSSNPVINILGSIFHRIHPVNIFTLFAIYIGMYRFLRWRLYPDESTYSDVPPWLFPTEAQKSIPHPVSIDFLPFPALRDYLTTHQNQDSRHSASLYIRCLRFRWPEDKVFYSTTPGGEIVLNPEFEDQLCVYDNWMLSTEWGEIFPHLEQYVNIEGSTSTDSERRARKGSNAQAVGVCL